jgi:5-(carboxyamino)imidazole ribonucleotide synthase
VSDVKPNRVGVLGAGQLALMLADAAKTLGVAVICAGQKGDCAERVAPLVVVDLDDAKDVAAFAAQVDMVTIESENIDADVLRGLKLYPNANAVSVAQDRLVEKRFFQQCGIEVAPFEAVDSLKDFEVATAKLGFPSILKTRRMGYDGKGQARLRSAADIAAAFAEVGGVPCILEGMVRFEAEVSLIAARGCDGEILFYPLIENVHRDGILRRSTMPYVAVTPALQSLAESYMTKVLDALEYVGVLAIEFFVVDGGLMANEMAPRVHNSGHWTIEGAKTSQFENHLRAILGMPLGSTESVPTVMLNCIGEMPAVEETSGFPLSRHDYGKAGREGRKVGHLTFPAGETSAIEEWYRRLNPEAPPPPAFGAKSGAD